MQIFPRRDTNMAFREGLVLRLKARFGEWAAKYTLIIAVGLAAAAARLFYRRGLDLENLFYVLASGAIALAFVYSLIAACIALRFAWDRRFT